MSCAALETGPGVSPRPGRAARPMRSTTSRALSARARTSAAGRPGVAAARRVRATGDGHLRLTHRGRVVLAVLAATVALGGVLGAQQSAQAGGPGEPVAVVRHVVSPGESLWSLAVTVAAPGEDVRDVVDRIRDLNAMTGDGLVVGQELLLPAE